MGNAASVKYSSSRSEPSRTSPLSIIKSNIRENRKHRYLKRSKRSDSSSSDSDSCKSSLQRKRKRHSRKHRNSLRNSNDEIFLTKEELNDLSAKELRNRCQQAGIDTSTIFEKKALIKLLLNYYREYNYENSNFAVSYSNDYGQIMEVIYESLPYFGEGNHSLDKYARENIQRLSVCISIF